MTVWKIFFIVYSMLLVSVSGFTDLPSYSWFFYSFTLHECISFLGHWVDKAYYTEAATKGLHSFASVTTKTTPLTNHLVRWLPRPLRGTRPQTLSARLQCASAPCSQESAQYCINKHQSHLVATFREPGRPGLYSSMYGNEVYYHCHTAVFKVNNTVCPWQLIGNLVTRLSLTFCM